MSDKNFENVQKRENIEALYKRLTDCVYTILKIALKAKSRILTKLGWVN